MGCLSLAIDIIQHCAEHANKTALRKDIEEKLDYLVSARPTAVNMKTAANELTELAKSLCDSDLCTLPQMRDKYVLITLYCWRNT